MSATPIEHSKVSGSKASTGFELTNFDVDGSKKRRSKSPSVSSTTFKNQASDMIVHTRFDDEESNEEISKQYKKFINAAKFNLNSEEVYCICRKPDHGGELMISCDGCDEWFHFKCMKLEEENSKLISKFYCKFCQWKGDGVTKWKRKCRIGWCREPAKADENSKYCSEEHGILFMTENLSHNNGSIQDLKIERIKDVLNFVDINYEKFSNLGLVFPELPEVIAFKEDNKKIDKFPLEIQQKLSAIEEKLDDIKSMIKLYEFRVNIITKYKDLVKKINDSLKKKVYPEVSPEKGNLKRLKSKYNSKSIEICCFDKTFNDFKYRNIDFNQLVTCDNLYETFKDYVDNIVSFVEKYKEDTGVIWFDNSVCIQDRKRCLRHNGWSGLLTDELVKKIDELTASLEEFENNKLLVLREYSNSVYEAQTSKP